MIDTEPTVAAQVEWLRLREVAYQKKLAINAARRAYVNAKKMADHQFIVLQQTRHAELLKAVKP